MNTATSTGAGTFDCTPDPMGDPCIECAKANCCMEIQTCVGDAECGACITCVQQTGDITQCIGMCNQSDPRTGALGQCVIGACAGDCGLGG
jgi:hypothetical protein